MKRWTWRTEKGVSGPKWDPRFATHIKLILEVRTAIEHRVMLHRIVAESRQLLVLALAVAANDQRFTRIVMPAAGGRDRKLICRPLARTYKSVRTGLGKKDDKKQRRQ